MSKNRDILICTVGTSLLSNLSRLEDGTIQNALLQNNWKRISLFLLEQTEENRLCGAEINSISGICKRGHLSSRFRLLFLVSDTEDGKNTGEILKLYYTGKANPWMFTEVQVEVLDGLRDDSVKDFRQKGLKNLVHQISKEVKRSSSDRVAINATGGYKAQISFAGMVGQALEIPVYYLFEKFSDVIELPPQPISLDLALWLENYPFFSHLESESIVARSEIATVLPIQYSLIEEEIIDGKVCISLSAMGELFHERCRRQFEKQQKVLMEQIPKTDTPPDQKGCKLRDDHGKKTLEEFCKKLFRSPYVLKVLNSLPFHPRQKTPILQTSEDGKIDFVLTWTDPGWGVCIQTTGRNKPETSSIALHLEKEFSE